MYKLLVVLGMLFLNKEILIFDFTKETSVLAWQQTNDDVMGGVSTSRMTIDENGHGVFLGNVSTANNGGFAMTRLPVDIKITEKHKKIVLYVKGDNKKYQFRLKSDVNQRHWYVHSFFANDTMQRIEIPLEDFYPSFRGNRLRINNFSSQNIKEIAILIGNKKNENFKLVIDKILVI
ncbi:CIA30 family protein [Aquimarina sp. 2201CG1-2-11]|uniref:CIA30 family protein n=1 Tax=Aquimarina discodermiae TaxID=3231043 RepID=UPI003461E79F